MQVSWDADISTYEEAELSDIFSKYGAVEEVIPRMAKKKSKGSAIVVMKDVEVCCHLNFLNSQMTFRTSCAWLHASFEKIAKRLHCSV